MNIRHWLIPALLLPLLPACSTPEAMHAKSVRSLLEARRENVVIQKYDLSCGAAALATMLTYQYGDRVTEREAALGMLRHTSAELVRQRLGFSLLDLKRYAMSRGFTADGYTDLTVDDLVNFGPTIVPVQLRGVSHFVIFRGVQGDRVLLADPAFGNRTMPVATFEQIWEGRIGFTISRTDGRPAPNLLAATRADFWASSGQMHLAAPVPPADAAADAAAGATDQTPATVLPVSRAEPQPGAAAAPAPAPAPAPAGEASVSAGPHNKTKPAPASVSIPTPASQAELVSHAAPHPAAASAPAPASQAPAVSLAAPHPAAASAPAAGPAGQNSAVWQANIQPAVASVSSWSLPTTAQPIVTAVSQPDFPSATTPALAWLPTLLVGF